MDKINVLEGDWIDDPYYDFVLPKIAEAKISICKQKTLPLTRLYDNEYWGSLRVHRVDLAVLDYRHWYYDDATFFEYVKKISEIKFPAICFSESPFGFELPSIDISSFEKKLYERSKTFSNLIRHKQPTTVLLSPAIRVLFDYDKQERYLDYFFHNYSLFDAYSLHCCTDMKEHRLGALTAFLQQILRTSFKPTWITKWAIPSCDHGIESEKMLQPTDWKPVRSPMAVRNLRKTYDAINEVAQNNTHWFFVGVGQDIYHPNKTVPIPYWQTSSLYRSDNPSTSWQPEHFMGCVDYLGAVKEKVLQGFLDLYREQT